MTDLAAHMPVGTPAAASRPKLDGPNNIVSIIAFFGIVGAALLFIAYSLYADVDDSGTKTTTFLPYLLLLHTMPAHFAVVWSGCFNFLGVVLSSGAVAFSIVSLLPVELILQVGSAAGFAMVFALLIAAIIWNLGTWYLGLPASSSHTLIGSIIGVGIANAMMHGQDGTSGVDWSKATEIGYGLLLSPIIGFAAAAILFLALKFVVHNPALYQAPKGDQPPPLG